MDPANEPKRPPKRKLKQPQSPLACESCRAKKVRCDLTERRTQCSRCANNGTKCNIVPGKRRHLVQRILGSSKSTGSTSLTATGYGYVSATSPASDSTSPSSASEGAQSPFSIISAGSCASSASSFNVSDLEFLSQFEKPASDDIALPLYVEPLPRHLTASTISDLQRAGCFDALSGDKRTAVVDAYLNWVHPTLPLIDAAQLRRLKNGQSISLLLFKAIELVACIHESHNSMSANILTNQVNELLKAKAEKNPLPVLQALILLSFSDGDPTGSRDGYYWIGLAATYAARLIQVQPDLSESLQRTLWCLSWRDSSVALASRRRRQLAPEICLLASSYRPDHLADNAASPAASTSNASEDGQSQFSTEAWTALYDLSGAVQTTVNLKLDQNKSKSETDATGLLRRWYIRWHETLREDVERPSHVVRNSTLLSYWSLAVLNLHCWSPRRPPASDASDYSLVTAALNCVTVVCVNVFEQNLIQHVPAAAVAALVPAAVAYLNNSTSKSSDIQVSNSQRYYQCWQILRELRLKHRTAHQAMLMLDSLGQRIREGFDTEEAEQMTRLKSWSAGSLVIA